MDVGVLSTRYAKALVQYAQEKGVEDDFYHEFDMLIKSFHHEPALSKALDNPIISVEDKLLLISTAVYGDQKPKEAFVHFMRLVLKNRRETYLHAIALMYIDLYRKLKHIGVGQLITAVPLSPETRARLRKAATTTLHAKMELKTVVDPAIQGGFIFDINDYRLDASVATQLKRVKQQFIDKNRRII